MGHLEVLINYNICSKSEYDTDSGIDTCSRNGIERTVENLF